MKIYKKAHKRIICDRCGKQFAIGNLDSYQDLTPHAKQKGWSITKSETLCPTCLQKIHPDDLLMKEILK